MSYIKNAIPDTNGNTPIVKFNNIAPEGVVVFVKLGAFNLVGSDKEVRSRRKQHGPQTGSVFAEH